MFFVPCFAIPWNCLCSSSHVSKSSIPMHGFQFIENSCSRSKTLLISYLQLPKQGSYIEDQDICSLQVWSSVYKSSPRKARLVCSQLSVNRFFGPKLQRLGIMRPPFSFWASAGITLVFISSNAAGHNAPRFPRKAIFERQTVQTCDSDEILGVFESFTQYSAQYTSECSTYLNIPDTTVTIGTVAAEIT